MPTTTTTLLHNCHVCHRPTAADGFSVASGICRSCFDTQYEICEECGRIMRNPSGSIRASVYPLGTSSHGQMLCGVCRQADCDAAYWRPTPLDCSIARYDRIGSKRKFGVEIETSQCSHYRRLLGKTHWGAKSDPTVSGMEFDSPILYGDGGLEQLEELLSFGADHGWAADSDCGCHTHYDMRDESGVQLTRIMYAYSLSRGMWSAAAPRRRSRCSYSRTPGWSSRELRLAINGGDRDFREVLRGVRCDRYETVNFTAYYDHRTFEVRLLEGTVDPNTICKWVTIHCRFIDGVRDKPLDELEGLFGGGNDSQVESLADLINEDELIDWLKSRKTEFSS